jgi:ribosomal protein S18 acetylase RimI-like enzyme
MKYRIFKATEDERAWLFDLHERTMKEYVEKVYGWDVKREQAYFDNRILFERYHLILAKYGEKIGAINFYHIENSIKINRIEVLPDYQNKGIGSAVLDQIIEKAKKENKNVELRVFKINPAFKLYARKGFKTYKETDTHYYMKFEYRQ